MMHVMSNIRIHSAVDIMYIYKYMSNTHNNQRTWIYLPTILPQTHIHYMIDRQSAVEHDIDQNCCTVHLCILRNHFQIFNPHKKV